MTTKNWPYVIFQKVPLGMVTIESEDATSTLRFSVHSLEEMRDLWAHLEMVRKMLAIGMSEAREAVPQ